MLKTFTWLHAETTSQEIGSEQIKSKAFAFVFYAQVNIC